MKNPQYKPGFSKTSKQDQRNLILAIVMSAVLVVAWQSFIEAPKRRELAKWNAAQAQRKEELLKKEESERAKETAQAPAAVPATREGRLGASPRVAIASEKLTGSIALKGLRFDDLELNRYRVGLEKDSPPVTLLSPQGGEDAYFMQTGWLATSGKTPVPDENSVWRADSDTLTPEKPVTFRWDNGQGLRFTVTVTLDENYLFSLTQRVENGTGAEISLSPYAYINRAYVDAGTHAFILHEGPLGVFGGVLNETAYKTLRKEGTQRFADTSGWLGITDKYWLSALVPDAPSFSAEMSYYTSKGADRYQVQYTLPPARIDAGASEETRLRLFAGAKELRLLDNYAAGNAQNNAPPIPLFDRAVDFGALYFLTKPMMKYLLIPFFHLAGNFGIALMLMTIVIKLLMFPLANKGYKATTQMRALQPEMQALREKYGKDRVRMQQELVGLYKREKVNPAAGCLPILVQIPVFFALYKVLYVTIEMRHAPFFGWLRDLSAPDPTNMFTLFGLFEWPTPPGFHIGVLPILMGVTMWLQMRQQPKPNDPTQARVMGFMPFLLTIVLAKMPAGLVLYWTWSNTLSIFQQWLITRKYNATHPDHPAK